MFSRPTDITVRGVLRGLTPSFWLDSYTNIMEEHQQDTSPQVLFHVSQLPNSVKDYELQQLKKKIQ